jgi:hypothetical protein
VLTRRSGWLRRLMHPTGQKVMTSAWSRRIQRQNRRQDYACQSKNGPN